ncbi:hypothetical protein LINPERHAP1_LOCUS34597 [Linum perenne]
MEDLQSSNQAPHHKQRRIHSNTRLHRSIPPPGRRNQQQLGQIYREQMAVHAFPPRTNPERRRHSRLLRQGHAPFQHQRPRLLLGAIRQIERHQARRDHAPRRLLHLGALPALLQFRS